MNRQKILIDTDPGQDIDDLLAITFALKRPELDVKAITTVTYPTDKRARMVRRLLRYLNRTDIPVAAGANLPLREMSEAELSAQRDLKRTLNHYAFAEPEDTRDDPGPDDAVDLIIETVERSPGEIALACIGPLTNVACALRRKPRIAAKIKYLAMMGGEVALNRIEHNVAFDYVAADSVLGAGLPVFMGTWDVTRRFVLTGEDCQLLARSPSPLLRALSESIGLWHPVQSWKPGPVMYDLFPIVWAYDRSLYTVQPMSVRVETKGEFTRGMTVPTGGSPNVEATTGINVEDLRSVYLETILT